MKFQLLIIIFIIIQVTVSGQVTKITNVKSARTVEINRGVVTIKQADTVIIKIYTSANLKTPLYLTFNETKFDSTLSRFVTKLKLTNPKEFEYYDVNIKLNFNKPVEFVQYISGLGVGTKYEESKDKKEFTLKMLRCDCDEGIDVNIISEEKVVVSISGISGESY